MTPAELQSWAPAISAIVGNIVVTVVVGLYARLGAKRAKRVLEQLAGGVLQPAQGHPRTDVVELPEDRPYEAPAPDPAPSPLPQRPIPDPQPAQPAPVVTSGEADLDTRALWLALGDDDDPRRR